MDRILLLKVALSLFQQTNCKDDPKIKRTSVSLNLKCHMSPARKAESEEESRQAKVGQQSKKCESSSY